MTTATCFDNQRGHASRMMMIFLETFFSVNFHILTHGVLYLDNQ